MSARPPILTFTGAMSYGANRRDSPRASRGWGPRGVVEVTEPRQDVGGAHGGVTAKHGAEVGQQPDTEADAAVGVVADQPRARLAGTLRPVAACGVGDGQQGFPDVGGPVGDAGRHFGPCASHGFGGVAGPVSELLADFLAFGLVDACPERLDVLVRGAAPHPDHDRPGEDRVGQLA